MSKKQMMKRRLIAQGFEQSYITRDGVKPVCSNCQALVINGIATHETGCNNAKHECNGCYELIPLRQRYCEVCQ